MTTVPSGERRRAWGWRLARTCRLPSACRVATRQARQIPRRCLPLGGGLLGGVLGCLVGCLLLACTAPPVHWRSEPIALAGGLGSGRVLALLGVPDRVKAVALPLPAPTAGLPPFEPGTCVASVRWARAGAGHVAIAWWVARRDSTVILRVARSEDDGTHWRVLPPADTADRGVRGCHRPAPAVALDAVHGETHVAYFLEPAAGAGLFAATGLDMQSEGRGPSDSGAMFQPPVAIVFGQGLSEASIAAHGDTIVVAYQDPNSRGPEIDLAVSTTDGRSFAGHTVASGVGVSGEDPTVVVDGTIVAVAWHESAAGLDGEQSVARDAPRRAARDVVRIGDIR